MLFIILFIFKCMALIWDIRLWILLSVYSYRNVKYLKRLNLYIKHWRHVEDEGWIYLEYIWNEFQIYYVQVACLCLSQCVNCFWNFGGRTHVFIPRLVLRDFWRSDGLPINPVKTNGPFRETTRHVWSSRVSNLESTLLASFAFAPHQPLSHTLSSHFFSIGFNGNSIQSLLRLDLGLAFVFTKVSRFLRHRQPPTTR